MFGTLSKLKNTAQRWRGILTRPIPITLTPRNSDSTRTIQAVGCRECFGIGYDASGLLCTCQPDPLGGKMFTQFKDWRAWFASLTEPVEREVKPAITEDQIAEWAQICGLSVDDRLRKLIFMVAEEERAECARLADLAAPFSSADLIRERGRR